MAAGGKGLSSTMLQMAFLGMNEGILPLQIQFSELTSFRKGGGGLPSPHPWVLTIHHCLQHSH